MDPTDDTCVAFLGTDLFAAGDRLSVVLRIKQLSEQAIGSVLIFEETTGPRQWARARYPG